MKRKSLALLVFLLAACGMLNAAAPRVVLVFPFENLSGDPNLGWMSEGIADLLATRLLSPARYVLQREERNTAYKQLGLSPTAPLTLASEYKVAQAIGANVAILGTFKVTDGQLTTSVQWLDVPGLKLSPAVEISGKLGDIDELETRAAWKIVTLHDKGLPAGTEEDFSHRFPGTRLDAFENYIRGVLATDAKSRIHFLRESDRLNPSDHRAAFKLGRFYFDQQDYADSVQWLMKLKPGDQDYPEALFISGIDDYFLGRKAAAQKAFSELAKQMPLGEVMNNLGVVEASLGNNDQALTDFDRAYQSDQSDPDFAFNLSVCLWSLQRYDRAVQYLRAVLQDAPDDVNAHAFLAEALGKLGFEKGREQELAWLAHHGKADDADTMEAGSDPAPHFQPEFRIKKKYDGRAFRLLALAILNASESRISQEPLQKIKNDGQRHLRQGMDGLSAGRFSDAERELIEAVSMLPGSSEAHRALGQVYEAEGKHTLAVAELEASLKEKDSAQAHLLLARAYLSLNHPEVAMKEVQAVLKLDSANAEAERLLDEIRAAGSSDRVKF